jgi:methylmalonyl-CoA mutase
VGVNKYRVDQNDDEQTASGHKVQVLHIDNSKVRESQIARLKKLKENRDEELVSRALAKLEESAMLGPNANTSDGNHPLNLLALSIEAAKVRCTLGEISSALEKSWGRHVPSTSVVQGAYSATFNQELMKKDEFSDVQTEVQAFEKKEGRRPRILVAKMGQDGHDRGAKVIASGFSDIGFDVDVGALFQTPHEVARQAIDADVHVIGVSSQAAGHKTLIPALVEELKKLSSEHIIVVAGGVIPPDDYDFLKSHGCRAIFGPGTRIIDAARDVLRMIPPSEL